MATWLAISRVFLPRVPLQGDRDCCSVRRRGTGTLERGLVWSACRAFEFKVEPQLFRALVLERLRLPLDVTDASCECGSRLGLLGSKRLRSRALGTERSLARVCREAGATVRCNTKLTNMNVHVPAHDERAIEVLASGLPLHHGGQLEVDITSKAL